MEAEEALANLLFEHTWGCGHCGGCKCDADEAASERPWDWAKHVAKLLITQGYTRAEVPGVG